ncbi:hypothetical protein U1Q18_026154 [Sarracenia purpurea var. burkii]
MGNDVHATTYGGFDCLRGLQLQSSACISASVYGGGGSRAVLLGLLGYGGLLCIGLAVAMVLWITAAVAHGLVCCCCSWSWIDGLLIKGLLLLMVWNVMIEGLADMGWARLGWVVGEEQIALAAVSPANAYTPAIEGLLLLLHMVLYAAAAHGLGLKDC